MEHISAYIKEKTTSGIVTKLLIQFNETDSAEVSLIERPEKNIICFSCMIGCPVGCVFCVSGVLDKYIRKLTAEEMVQSIFFAKSMAKHPDRRWVISAMGEGEPALNIENVLEAMTLVNMMFTNVSYAISTSAPNKASFENLLHRVLNCTIPIKLQYSFHGARPQLFRLSHYPAYEVLRQLTPDFRSRVEVEINITLIKGINDTPDEFRNIVRDLFVHQVPWNVKLNRYNPSSEVHNLQCASFNSYMELKNLLKNYGNKVEYYETDGADIAAACGQLSAKNVNKKRGAQSRAAHTRELQNVLPSVAEVS